MKKSSWILFLSFIAGVMAANILGKDWFFAYGGLDSHVLSEISRQRISNDKYFWYVFGRRIQVVIMLFLLSKAVNVKRVIYGCMCLLPFSFGWFFTVAVLENGIKGIAVGIIAVLPHGIFYLLAFLLWQKMKREQAERGARRRIYREKKEDAVLIGMYAAIFVLLITGIVLESYVNPVCLKSAINM